MNDSKDILRFGIVEEAVHKDYQGSPMGTGGEREKNPSPALGLLGLGFRVAVLGGVGITLYQLGIPQEVVNQVGQFVQFVTQHNPFPSPEAIGKGIETITTAPGQLPHILK